MQNSHPLSTTFMGLPFEIRQMICRYLARCDHILYSRHILSYTRSSGKPLVEGLDVKKFPPTISLASKRLRAEVFPLLFQVNTIDMDVPCNTADAIGKFEQQNGLRDSNGGCAALRHVFLWLPDNAVIRHQSWKVLDILPFCTNITTIRIKIMTNSYGDSLDLGPIRHIFKHIRPASILLHLQFCDLDEGDPQKSQDLATGAYGRVKIMIRAENFDSPVQWELSDMFDDVLMTGGDLGQF